jgi:hypothetical protein
VGVEAGGFGFRVERERERKRERALLSVHLGDASVGARLEKWVWRGKLCRDRMDELAIRFGH